MSEHSHSKLALALHGATLWLETEYSPFLVYARRYLTDFPAAGEATPDVRVCLHWNASPARSGHSAVVYRRGRRVFQFDHRVLQTEILHFPGLQLEVEWSGPTLLIDAYYRPTSRLERLTHRLKREPPQLFVMLIYYLVYFPLIHYLKFSSFCFDFSS